MLTRRQSLFMLPAVAIAPSSFAFDLGRALTAATGLAVAASITDDDVRAHARRMAEQMDRGAAVAPEDSPHAKRLAALTASCREDQGLALNYKVYMTPEVNAFALADGSIRFYSGLMDKMTDEEVRYVIGHEIGHVQSGHTRKRMQLAMSSGALQQAAAAAGGRPGALAQSELGDLFVKVVRAQHSQSNENEADDYAMQFLSRRRHDRGAAVTALEKLASLSGGHGGVQWLSTHPAPKDRAARLRQQMG
jgi:putative metalloprotease